MAASPDDACDPWLRIHRQSPPCPSDAGAGGSVPTTNAAIPCDRADPYEGTAFGPIILSFPIIIIYDYSQIIFIHANFKTYYHTYSLQ